MNASSGVVKDVDFWIQRAPSDEGLRAQGFSESDVTGLVGVSLVDLNLLHAWMGSGLPNVNGWAEVTRHNILDRGLYRVMIEEGLDPKVAASVGF